MKAELNSHEYWMRAALKEAQKGVGLTRPNPPVGAVVVRRGKIVGRGFHPKAGKPHAEIYALSRAGLLARGSTLYVTLEPCCTTGRTPPCTEAIIKAGIKRVVYACVDCNPRHAGRADAILRRAGIEVIRGVAKDAAATLIRPFAMKITKGRPYITLKLACTLDGKIADFNGRSKWITGEASRSVVQELRRTADAIMIGAGTLRSDNPSLMPRPMRGRNPYRIIIKGKQPLPVGSKVLRDSYAARTKVFEGSLGLKRIMRELARLDVMHIVCEGGGVLAEKLLRAGLVDEMWIFYAPKFLGGTGRVSVAGPGWRLPSAPLFSIVQVRQIGDDLLVRLEKQHV